MQISDRIRASRALLNWNQQQLADEAGLSKPTINNIEAGGKTPERKTLDALEFALQRHGIFWTANGIERRSTYITELDNYMAVLDDVAATLPGGGEVLVHCADDRRSSPEVSERLAEMARAGFTFRKTISDDNPFHAGDPALYRAIPHDFFAQSEVSVIYGPKVCQHVAGDEKLFLVMYSAAHADVMRKQFEYWWTKGKSLK